MLNTIYNDSNGSGMGQFELEPGRDTDWDGNKYNSRSVFNF